MPHPVASGATQTSIEEQRLRSPLPCTRLTSGNEFPHTMIGGRCLIAALSHAFEYCAPLFTGVRQRPGLREHDQGDYR